MRKRLPLFVAVLLSLTGSTIQAVEHTKDTLDTVQKAVAEKKAVLLDVREQGEWDAGHLRDAQLLPLSRLEGTDAQTLAKILNKDRVIYCHCRSGVRTLKAAEILLKQGYDVRPLKPGYQELLKAGFPGASK